MKDQILQLLNREQYFLMYRAGAGGEFLSDLIVNTSTKFRKLETTYDINNNRTQINLPKFYKCLGSVKTKDTNTDVLIDKIIQAHRLFNYDIEQSIVEANDFLNTGLPPLLKTHYTFSDYFNKTNTWVILQDESKWFEYTSLLFYLKVGTMPVPKEDAKNLFYYPLAQFPHKKELVDRALEYIENNNIETVYSIQYEPLMCDQSQLNLSFEEIFHSPPELLIQKYWRYFDDTYEHFYAKTIANMSNKVNIIPFSKIFVKGYIESLFDIETDVSGYILEWHHKNLEILKRYGVETNKYIDE